MRFFTANLCEFFYLSILRTRSVLALDYPGGSAYSTTLTVSFDGKKDWHYDVGHDENAHAFFLGRAFGGDVDGGGLLIKKDVKRSMGMNPFAKSSPRCKPPADPS